MAKREFNGGCSGGGSINIFYKDISERGTINVEGGLHDKNTGWKGGQGGRGSVFIGNIKTGTYIEK